ncbi:helix-turn-helix domain-containing protein [Halomonas cupida]|uniref:Transcriptional regulator, XRE family with cupin sensor n=1 Tax=Halomonas cupida TaxID=44933 RepID=A0A1M7A976_9GAMM|nr:helix-turn-helix domain-containing protein [Halomonas cupida]GEN22480.1 XRE family transcriptional regulator [Halomonas cupida]SHL39334.1 transcriptional regulator, XRE family with cupin sensor [Halomonas cupida]
MQDIAGHIATTLRRLRQQQGWSLDQAARLTGVSKAMLGQIERSESSPTVSTLWKIASGFRVSLSELLEGADETVGLRQRDGHERVWGEDSAGMQARVLFPFDPQLGFEMFEVELAPGAESASSPHAPGVVEHIVVLEGSLALQVGEQWQHLAVGQGLRFQADQPHLMRNAGEGRLRFHDVIHYRPPVSSSNSAS